MTMLTRCAACNTAFRITTDQLVSRQGKVRCGRCGEIFNALDKLVPHPGDSAGDPDSGFASASAGLVPAAAEAAGSYDLFGAPPQPSNATPPSAPAIALLSNSLLGETARKDRTFPWWSAVGSLLAAIALVAQAAFHYRDPLAMQYPQTKPFLEQACEQLGCRVEAPVDPQAISIESHDLQVDNGNRAVLILSAVLRNRASFAQRLPMLELSLIDAADAPLARRVLAPSEYANSATPPTIAASGEIQVKVFLDAAQVKASGYRLYAFYP